MSICPANKHCKFYKKFKHSNHFGCKMIIKIYCQGPKAGECQRLIAHEYSTKELEENFLPTGAYLSGYEDQPGLNNPLQAQI